MFESAALWVVRTFVSSGTGTFTALLMENFIPKKSGIRGIAQTLAMFSASAVWSSVAADTAVDHVEEFFSDVKSIGFGGKCEKTSNEVSGAKIRPSASEEDKYYLYKKLDAESLWDELRVRDLKGWMVGFDGGNTVNTLAEEVGLSQKTENEISELEKRLFLPLRTGTQKTENETTETGTQ